MNKITRFTIGKANYFVTSSKGENIELILDYANNTYSVKIKEVSTISDELKAQMEFIANHLLSDKAGKNLVSRLRKKSVIS